MKTADIPIYVKGSIHREIKIYNLMLTLPTFCVILYAMKHSRTISVIRLCLIAIPIIVLSVNVGSLFFIDPLARLMVETEVLGIIDSITIVPAVHFLNQILPISIFAILLFWYCFPMYREFWNGRVHNDINPALLKRLLNSATYMALLTGLGWVISIPILFIAGAVLEIHMSADFFLEYTAHSLVLFGFDFIIVYYTVETMVRRLLIPGILQGNEVLSIKPRLSLSISSRLFILTSAAFFLPSLIFFVAIRILNNGGDNSFGRDLMPILEIALPILCALIFFITWFKVQSIDTPIKELIKAASRVKEGVFDKKVTVSASDRLGNLGGAFNEMMDGLAEREKMSTMFGKIVDPRVRDYLMDEKASREGKICQAAVVFFDLAGFTSLSESLPAKEIVKLLNLYFEAVSSCVENQGGLINKFIGDGVLAVFGAPAALENHTEKAVSAVESLYRVMNQLNKKLALKNIPPLKFRAGIHTGEVLSGVIGSKKRQEYTVIGDAVNVASRIEPLGKTYGETAIISKPAVKQLLRGRKLKSLGEIQIRGKSEKMELFGLTFTPGKAQ